MNDIKTTIKNNQIKSVVSKSNITAKVSSTKINAKVITNKITGVIRKYTVKAYIKTIPIIYEADLSNIYTKDEVDDALSTKANKSEVYTRNQIDTALDDKADANHTHAELHEHTNKIVLDKFGENSGKPTYDGEKIGGTSFFIATEYEMNETENYIYRGGINSDEEYQINRQSIITGLHDGSALGDWADRTTLTYT